MDWFDQSSRLELLNGPLVNQVSWPGIAISRDIDGSEFPRSNPSEDLVGAYAPELRQLRWRHLLRVSVEPFAFLVRRRTASTMCLTSAVRKSTSSGLS